jgi:hypothetical protein
VTRGGKTPGLALASALLAASALAREAGAEEPRTVLLDVPGPVAGLLLEDADGDGTKDLALLVDREVLVFRGGARASFPASPSWRLPLPPDATFCDLEAPGSGAGGSKAPRLVALAGRRLVRVAAGAEPATVGGVGLDLAWGPGRALFADLAGRSRLLLPSATGWRWFPAWPATDALDLVQAPHRVTSASGAFLDESATVDERWGAPHDAGGSVWILGPGGLRSFRRGEEGAVATTTIPVSLGNEAGRAIRNRLVDLDADGVPDLCHEATSNLDGVYAFFRTPRPGEGETLGPARAVVHLSGFQIPASYPDLDGDGRPDLVVTTIEIDATNTMRAIGGKVTAKTKAFRNRSAEGGDFFPGKPDAERESTVGVAIRFSYTGAIDVERSFTIVPGGDLDGDGRKDLAIRTAPDALTVWPGLPGGRWGEEPRRVSVPAMETGETLDAHPADLTGDGKDDLVLVYGPKPGGRARVAVWIP